MKNQELIETAIDFANGIDNYASSEPPETAFWLEGASACIRELLTALGEAEVAIADISRKYSDASWHLETMTRDTHCI